MSATAGAAGVYTLTGLLRGRRGTEWAAATEHAALEEFTLLRTVGTLRVPRSADDERLGVGYWQALTAGQTTQDGSVQRLDDFPPPDSSPPPASSDIGQESPSDLDDGKGGSARTKRRTPKKRKRASMVAGTECPESPALPIGSPKWNRGPGQSNFFSQKYLVNHGAGMKLGPAITVSALLIQGPFPTEDKADADEHKRQVQSAMLNVLDDARVQSFIEEGLTRREEMTAYCLARMESPRVTRQRAVAALQKFLNTEFFGPLGCTPRFRGTRLTYHYCIEAVS